MIMPTVNRATLRQYFGRQSMNQRFLQHYAAAHFACPIDPDLRIEWTNAHSLGIYLASQAELDWSDPMAQARRTIISALAANDGRPVTAGDCWHSYLGAVLGDNPGDNLEKEGMAFCAAWQTVLFASRFSTNRQPEVDLPVSRAHDYTGFVLRYLEAVAPSGWETILEHTIALNLIALLEINGSTTRNSAFRTIIEAVDEISTTGGLHLQQTTRRILDRLLAELFPWAYQTS